MKRIEIKVADAILVGFLAFTPSTSSRVMQTQIGGEGSIGCDTLASVRTDLNIYWNPMTGEYDNVPWFKMPGDTDPHNKNPSIDDENAARIRCGLSALEMANLSSANPDVDLDRRDSRLGVPLVRGMTAVAWLCQDECSWGEPLYTRNVVKTNQSRRK